MDQAARLEHWICRRQTPRFRLGLPARLITLERHLNVVLKDLSEDGAQIALPVPHEFAVCVIKWLDYHAFAEVRWARDDLVGLKFASQLPIATLEQSVQAALASASEPKRTALDPRRC
jgi:hypothetical protein